MACVLLCAPHAFTHYRTYALWRTLNTGLTCTHFTCCGVEQRVSELRMRGCAHAPTGSRIEPDHSRFELSTRAPISFTCFQSYAPSQSRAHNHSCTRSACGKCVRANLELRSLIGQPFNLHIFPSASWFYPSQLSFISSSFFRLMWKCPFPGVV